MKNNWFKTLQRNFLEFLKAMIVPVVVSFIVMALVI